MSSSAEIQKKIDRLSKAINKIVALEPIIIALKAEQLETAGTKKWIGEKNNKFKTQYNAFIQNKDASLQAIYDSESEYEDKLADLKVELLAAQASEAKDKVGSKISQGVQTGGKFVNDVKNFVLGK